MIFADAGADENAKEIEAAKRSKSIIVLRKFISNMRIPVCVLRGRAKEIGLTRLLGRLNKCRRMAAELVDEFVFLKPCQCGSYRRFWETSTLVVIPGFQSLRHFRLGSDTFCY